MKRQYFLGLMLILLFDSGSLYAHRNIQHYNYKSSMGRSERLLRTYIESALYDDLILLKRALSEYRSWYNTRRSCDESRICIRLSVDARELIRNIMYHAKRYVSRSHSSRTSILSSDGDAYYQQLLAILDEYFESSQPCGSECHVPVEV